MHFLHIAFITNLPLVKFIGTGLTGRLRQRANIQRRFTSPT